MAGRVIRLPWLSQPSESSVAASLEFAPSALINFAQGVGSPNLGLVQTGRADWVTDAGSTEPHATPAGLGVRNGSGNHTLAGTVAFGRPAANSPAWFACVYTHAGYQAVGASSNVIAVYGSSTTTSGTRFQYNSSSVLTASIQGVSISTGYTLVSGQTYHLLIARDAVGNVWVWCDGTLIASDTGSTAAFASNCKLVCLGDSLVTKVTLGSLAMVALGVSDIQNFGAQLSASLWQLFEPQSIWVPESAGTVQAITLQADGSLLYKPAAAGGDNKLYLTTAGEIAAKAAAGAGDRRISISGGNWLAN